MIYISIGAQVGEEDTKKRVIKATIKSSLDRIGNTCDTCSQIQFMFEKKIVFFFGKQIRKVLIIKLI